ncbi:MAG: phage holin family protein [Bacteroidaceae bacterium]|nr:phage holin family protein [Bacteroidaceae bacterium]
MSDFSFHLNITQDIGHGMTLIFICAVAILLAVLIDLSTGVERAKKCKERIKSHILRRTISKVVDYYRLLFFGVIIDVLGLAFVWYNMPYCAVVVAVGVVLIEAKSVLENYHKMKSAARDMPAVVKQIIDAVTDKDAEKIIELIKDNDKREDE